jgi:hypothetical protein
MKDWKTGLCVLMFFSLCAAGYWAWCASERFDAYHQQPKPQYQQWKEPEKKEDFRIIVSTPLGKKILAGLDKGNWDIQDYTLESGNVRINVGGQGVHIFVDKVHVSDFLSPSERKEIQEICLERVRALRSRIEAKQAKDALENIRIVTPKEKP